MRGVGGVVGLLLALAVVGLLAKRMLAPAAAPSGPSTEALTPTPLPSDPKAQQEQIRRAVEAALQAPRPQPDDR